MRQQSITKGFAILSAASIIVKVLSLLYIPFLLAIIGEEGNGIYAAAFQVYVFVYVLTNSGIPVAISKLVSELVALNNYKDAVRSFKIARFMLFIIGTLMMVLMFVFASWISKALHFEKSYLAILALSPALLFTSVASAYRGYFQGRGNMTPTAVSQVIEQIINTVFTLLFAIILIRYSLEAACAGGTIGTSLGAFFSATFLILVYNARNKASIPKTSTHISTPRYSYGQLVKKILNYSIPITLCVGMQYAGNLVDLWNTKSRLLAAGLTDERATQMYSYLYKYQQLMNVPISIVVALAATMLPAISGAVALKSKEEIQSKINYAFRACFLIIIPSAVGFSVLSKPIFSMLKYGGGSYLMLYGSIVIVLMAIVQIQTTVLQGSSKLYTVTFFLVLGIVGKITTNYFLISIPEINIIGAIFGSIVGFSIPLVLNLIVIKKSLKTNLSLLGHAIKPLAASVFMGLTVYVVHSSFYALLSFSSLQYLSNALATIASVFAGIFTYLYCLVLFKGITREDLNFMPSSLTRIIPSWILNKIR